MAIDRVRPTADRAGTLVNADDGGKVLLPKITLAAPDGSDINVGVPVHLKTVQVAALDATTAANDLGTLLGGTVLADAIAGNLAGLAGYKLSFILMTVETNDVRVSFDDQDPATNGGVWKKDSAKPHCIDVKDFTKVRVVAATGTAKVTFQLFA